MIDLQAIKERRDKASDVRTPEEGTWQADIDTLIAEVERLRWRADELPNHVLNAVSKLSNAGADSVPHQNPSGTLSSADGDRIEKRDAVTDAVTVFHELADATPHFAAVLCVKCDATIPVVSAMRTGGVLVYKIDSEHTHVTE
jgi:hypothetical protein